MSEVKTKANPDYSKSAVNLTNPKEVEEDLDELFGSQKQLSHLQVVLKERNEGLLAEIEAVTRTISELTQKVKETIDRCGSYQDVVHGVYAVKYARHSREYHAEEFDAAYPKFAAAVLVKTVNVKAIEGLLKGGLLTEEDLRARNVLTETETYAYKIEAGKEK